MVKPGVNWSGVGAKRAPASGSAGSEPVPGCTWHGEHLLQVPPAGRGDARDGSCLMELHTNKEATFIQLLCEIPTKPQILPGFSDAELLLFMVFIY